MKQPQMPSVEDLVESAKRAVKVANGQNFGTDLSKGLKTMQRTTMMMSLFYGLLALSFAGTVIWAIIRLVLFYT